MPASLANQISFNAGEWAPSLDCRFDLPKYKSACRHLDNFIALREGGATKRPGTQYIGSYWGTGTPRLMTFQYNPSTGYVLQWGHQVLNFYKNGVPVVWGNWATGTYYSVGQWVYNGATTTGGSNWYQCLVSHTSGTFNTDLAASKWSALNWFSSYAYVQGNYTVYNQICYVCVQNHTSSGSFTTDLAAGYWEVVNGIPYGLATPYSATLGSNPYQNLGDVFGLDRVTINDVMYIVHPNYKPYKLVRYGDANWTLSAVDFNIPALIDENVTDTTLKASSDTASLPWSAWVSGTTYTANTLVIDTTISPNKVYVCILGLTSTTAPHLDATHWQVTGINNPVSSITGPVTLTATAPAWTSGYYYQPGNSVLYSGALYVCIANHTASTFSTDLSSGYWTAQTIFQSGHVGSTWVMRFQRSSSYAELALTATGTSSKIHVRGNYTITTYGTWNGDVVIYASYDNGQTYKPVKTLTSRGDGANWTISQAESVDAIYYIKATITSGTSPARVTITCDTQYVTGLVKITSVTNSTTAKGTAVNALYVDSTSSDGNPLPTAYWSEPAWSDVRGYPRAITSYQQRVWYAGTASQPQTIWATVTDDIQNFDRGDGSLATDSIAITLNATGDGTIEWMANQQDLYCGLDGAEWILNAGDSTNAAITATSIFARRQSKYGSGSVPAAIVGDVAMFVGRGGQTLRQMQFSVFQNKYMTQDMLAFSKHVVQTGIQQIAVQNRFKNHSILWTISGGQYLSAMTYDLEQDVAAWSRHHTFNTWRGTLTPGVFATNNHDQFMSVTTVNGTDPFTNDEVWVVVKRYNNQDGGNNRICIERLYPSEFELGGTEDAVYPNSAWFLDSGVTITVGAETDPTYQFFTHLKGYSVNAYIVDNTSVVTDTTGQTVVPVSCIQNLTVNSAGKVTVTGYTPQLGDTLIIGVPYLAYVQPMRLDVDVRQGYTAALTKSISEVYVRLLNTGSLTVGRDAVSGQEVQFRTAGQPQYLQLFTGEKEVVYQNQSDTDPAFVLRSTDGMPCTILGIHLKYNIDGTP